MHQPDVLKELDLHSVLRICDIRADQDLKEGLAATMKAKSYLRITGDRSWLTREREWMNASIACSHRHRLDTNRNLHLMAACTEVSVAQDAEQFLSAAEYAILTKPFAHLPVGGAAAPITPGSGPEATRTPASPNAPATASALTAPSSPTDRSSEALWEDNIEPVIEDYPPEQREKLLLDAANDVLGDLPHAIESDRTERIALATELIEQAAAHRFERIPEIALL